MYTHTYTQREQPSDAKKTHFRDKKAHRDARGLETERWKRMTSRGRNVALPASRVGVGCRVWGAGSRKASGKYGPGYQISNPALHVPRGLEARDVPRSTSRYQGCPSQDLN